MVDLPPPLTSAECDLRDFQFMPIDIVRLFGSRFHAVASDAEWRAGITLWLKSFHQVPAASIPDDDVELARLAELGRDLKGWKKLREGALHGWVKCSDGRYYHPVVAEKANEAFKKKEFYRERSRKASAKRWPGDDADKDGHSNANGNAEALQQQSHKDSYKDASSNPSASQGTVRVKGQGEEDSSAAAKRGARLPKDFVMPAEWKDWAAATRHWSAADIETEAASFADYWHGKTGKDATKLDWAGTWRNWVRNSRRIAPVNQSRGDDPEMPLYA